MKTHFVKIGFFGSFALMLFCCNSVNESSRNLLQESNVKLNDYELVRLYQMRGETSKLPISEAKTIALQQISSLNESVNTRSVSERDIASVKPILRVGTMASNNDETDIAATMPDTMAYVINYSNNMGFAVVSADHRIVNPVLAFSSSGEIDVFSENPGIKLFVSQMQQYCMQSIELFEKEKDLIKKQIISKLLESNSQTRSNEDSLDIVCYLRSPDPDETFSEHEWSETISIYSHVGPLLPVEWGQYFPFNENVKYNNCPSGTAPAGCVPIAIAQLLAYWQYPSEIDGVSLDWDLLRRYSARSSTNEGAYEIVQNTLNLPTELDNHNTDQQAFITQSAYLLERIGFHVGAQYSCGATGANPYSGVSYLNTLGFSADSPTQYAFERVKSSLDAQRPVYIFGFDTNGAGGHTWVCDGYHITGQKYIVHVDIVSDKYGTVWDSDFELTETTITNQYVHHNWGWYAIHNGFFLSNCFDTTANKLPSNVFTRYNLENSVTIFPNIYH